MCAKQLLNISKIAGAQSAKQSGIGSSQKLQDLKQLNNLEIEKPSCGSAELLYDGFCMQENFPDIRKIS